MAKGSQRKRRSRQADRTAAYRMVSRERAKRYYGESIVSQVTRTVALSHEPGVHGRQGTTY